MHMVVRIKQSSDPPPDRVVGKETGAGRPPTIVQLILLPSIATSTPAATSFDSLKATSTSKRSYSTCCASVPSTSHRYWPLQPGFCASLLQQHWQGWASVFPQHAAPLIVLFFQGLYSSAAVIATRYHGGDVVVPSRRQVQPSHLSHDTG